MNWPHKEGSKSVTALDYVDKYPDDSVSYAGLYGYNLTYTSCKFLGESNRFYIISSEFKSQHRLFIADLDNPGSIRWINFLNKTLEE